MYKGKPTNQRCSIFRWVVHQHLLFGQINELCSTVLIQNFSKVFLIANLTEQFLLVPVIKGIDITTMSCCLFWQGRAVAGKTKLYSFDEQWLSMLF